MRIAVIGAGLMGRAITKVLSEQRGVSEIVVGDVDQERAEYVANRFGGGKARAVRADLTDVEGTAKVLKGAEVLVNAAQYYYNLEAMKVALLINADYLDLGGLYHVTLKQLGLSEEFSSKGLIAVLGMGAQPGVTNVLASHASRLLDKMVTVKIRDGTRNLTNIPSEFVATWSLLTLLDEFTLDAVVYEEGEIKYIPPLSRSEVVDFPEPVGKMRTYVTIHSEIATLPSSFKDKGLRHCDWMEGFDGIESLKMIAEIGLTRTDEITLAGRSVRPRDVLVELVKSKGLIGYPEGIVPNDWEATKVIVKGERLGRGVTLTYDVIIPPKPEWAMSCAQIGVSVPAAMVALMICEGEVEKRGALPPEKCIEPEPLLEAIAKYGLKVKLTEEEALN